MARDDANEDAVEEFNKKKETAKVKAHVVAVSGIQDELDEKKKQDAHAV